MSRWKRFIASLKPPSASEMYERTRLWVKTAGVWWMASLMGHMILLIVIALILGTVTVAQNLMPNSFETVIEEPVLDELERFEVGEAPLEPTVLDTESLTMELPSQTEQINDNSADFEERGGGLAVAADASLGGLGGFDVNALGDGPVVRGAGGAGTGVGTGMNAGSGGDGTGFGSRGAGMRKALVGTGGTPGTERAVAAGLNWLARHQNANGSWSIDGFANRCKDGKCTGHGGARSDAAGTALGLLPFLAAGQTHQSKGPYQKNINGALYWFMKNQTKDGSLASGSGSEMYSHGLAAIAMCEAYGMTKDKQLGASAQGALQYIEYAQDSAGGGWRYRPGQPGDTSVVGWQVMALKSGQMAGLKVSDRAMQGAHKFLKSCQSGDYGGRFSYLPDGNPTPTLSAVGLLCAQYMGLQKGDPVMLEGLEYLMKNQPRGGSRNIYYWYYATQVMHNVQGKQWDAWNRNMRRMLIDTQVKEGCAAGSWDPQSPTEDAYGDQGGRIMVTSLSVLTLEIYYRYLPLYKTENENPFEEKKADAKAEAKADDKGKDKET